MQRPHSSHYPDPIAFEPGDVVTIGSEDSEYPGWIRVRTGDGKEGWAPKAYLGELSDGRALALTAYTARELNTTSGERLTVRVDVAGWVWAENDRGESGWVPAETVI